MLKKLELYFKDVIRGRKKGIIPACIKVLLWPLSVLFRFIVSCRNRLYDAGVMRRYIPPVPLVVSVGNIVAGGTGKTPVTLLLAQAFCEQFSVAILSRGYRSQAERLGYPIVVSEGQGPLFSAAYCGDEPYIFAKRLPNVQVVVGGNRQKASGIAAKAGVDVILLDDAMQHRRLARDFDIAVVDVTDPFGQGYFLPRGFLREDANSLSRAHLIVLNHICDQAQFQAVKKQLRTYSSAPVIGTRLTVTGVREMTGMDKSISLQGKKVGMFCGIAHPESFRKTLVNEGAVVVAEYPICDHDSPRLAELEAFAARSREAGAEYLACTEKDRVKLDDSIVLALPIVWLQMDLQVVEGREEWEQFLAAAKKKIKE